MSSSYKKIVKLVDCKYLTCFCKLETLFANELIMPAQLNLAGNVYIKGILFVTSSNARISS